MFFRKHRRSIIAMTVGLSLVTMMALVSYRSTRGTPEWELEQIRLASESPAKSLIAVRALIQSARGDFPEAQLLECQLLLRLRKLNDAKVRFAELQHLELCDHKHLARFAEQAQAVGENDLVARALLAMGNDVHRNPQHLKHLIFALYSRQNADEPEGRILQLCEEYSQLVPDDAFPWLISSSLYHERGVPKLAIHAYRESLRRSLAPEELHRTRTQLVQLELLVGDLPQARDHCDDLLKETRDPELRKLVSAIHAELLQREGRPAEAINLLDQLLAGNPDWTQARVLRGRCRFDVGDMPGAISDLSEVVRVNDFDQESHYVLSQAYRQQKNEFEANRHLNRSRALSDVMSQILTLENRLRNDLYNRELKLQLAELNEKRGDKEKAAAWRRGAERLQGSLPVP